MPLFPSRLRALVMQITEDGGLVAAFGPADSIHYHVGYYMVKFDNHRSCLQLMISLN